METYEDMGGEVTNNGTTIPKVENFQYLGLIIQQNENIDEDTHKSGLVKMEVYFRCAM